MIPKIDIQLRTFTWNYKAIHQCPYPYLCLLETATDRNARLSH